MMCPVSVIINHRRQLRFVSFLFTLLLLLPLLVLLSSCKFYLQTKGKKFNVTREILRINSPEKYYILLGLLISLISGGVQSSFPILITEVYDVSWSDPKNWPCLEEEIIIIFKYIATYFLDISRTGQRCQIT